MEPSSQPSLDPGARPRVQKAALIGRKLRMARRSPSHHMTSIESHVEEHVHHSPTPKKDIDSCDEEGAEVESAAGTLIYHLDEDI
jgi:hypothetical protein